MRKLSFRCPDGVVNLSKEAPEQLEERVIGIYGLYSLGFP